MIPLFVIALGAFVFPATSGPVPSKLKIAFLSYRLIVRFSFKGVPSSIYSQASMVCITGKLLDKEKL